MSPSTGSWTEAYKVVWTERCDWDCDSVLARIARLGLLYGQLWGRWLTGELRKNGMGGFTRAHFRKNKKIVLEKSAPFAGVRLVIADLALGLPVLRTLSLCTWCRHYPGAAAGRTLRSASPSRISLPRKGCRVGLRIVLFEDYSAFTRVTARTFALSPIRAR
jgi:hypothetical protein